jgi:hypothetical protein
MTVITTKALQASTRPAHRRLRLTWAGWEPCEGGGAVGGSLATLSRFSVRPDVNGHPRSIAGPGSERILLAVDMAMAGLLE